MGSFYMYVGSREKERAGCARGQFACEDAGKKEAGARAEGGKGEGRVGAGCARGQFACGDAGKKEADARPEEGEGRRKVGAGYGGWRRRMAAEEGATCTSL